MLEKKLLDFVDLIQHQHAGGKLELDKLEDITSLIIAEDDFDSLPTLIQDAIYFIDMCDIENPSAEQIMESARIIEDFVNRSNKAGVVS